jgi:hypothetical protein
VEKLKSFTPMKFLTCLFTIFIFTIGLKAQEGQIPQSQTPDTLKILTKEKSKYKFFGLTQFTFNQAYFENWVSGGENSMTGLFSIDYNINYIGKQGWVWDNNIMLSIGTTYLSGSTFFRKADDRIEINSIGTILPISILKHSYSLGTDTSKLKAKNKKKKFQEFCLQP